jgi:hypothetical protein
MDYEYSLEDVLHRILKADIPPRDKHQGIFDFKYGVQNILRDHV